MKKIEIDFVDFWPGFDKENNFFINMLRKNYEVEISAKPQYIFVSLFGTEFLKYDCVKICFIGENIRPDFRFFDYAMGFDWLSFGDRYYRLPLYRTYETYSALFSKRKFNEIPKTKNKFCNFIYSNGRADRKREEFFCQLSNYKKVDSGGRYLNNIGGPIDDKRAFQSEYKFSIAFENTSSVGYTTEKITDAFVANTIPIYWGNPDIAKEFNANAFINCHAFASFDDVITYIKKIDSDDHLFLKMLNEPVFLPNKPDDLCEDKIMAFFDGIFATEADKAKRCSDNYWEKYWGNYWSEIYRLTVINPPKIQCSSVGKKGLGYQAEIKLNLGSGRQEKDGWINVDMFKQAGVDYVVDFEACNKIPMPFAESSVTAFWGEHILERVRNIFPFMQELYRIAKPNAVAVFDVEYGSSYAAFENPTYENRFLRGAFKCFSQPTPLKGKFPAYQGNWKTEKIILYVKQEQYKNTTAEYILRDIDMYYNVVQNMRIQMKAVKPLGENTEDDVQPEPAVVQIVLI